MDLHRQPKNRRQAARAARTVTVPTTARFTSSRRNLFLYCSSAQVGITHGRKGKGNRSWLTYPCTLILENESTAREEIGCPIDIAGRNVVKISILFTCGRSS